MWSSRSAGCLVCARYRPVDEVLGLEALHDIVLPPVPPLWPPGQGFWVALLLAGVTAAVLWHWHRERQRRNAYRAAGLQLLAQAHSAYEVSVVLKRVALAAWPREQVAPLHGSDWARFLNDTCRQCRFSGDALGRSDTTAEQALRDDAARWIRRHTVPGDRQGSAA